jgi:hypothetical protein
MNIRASSVPLVLHCGQSNKGEIAVDDEIPGGRLGTAAHYALADMLIGRRTFGLDDLAEKHDCDLDELGRLYAYGVQAWDKLKLTHPKPMAEVPLETDLGEGVTLTGTADLLAVTPDMARVIDWKSGRVREDYWPQLKAYALLAHRKLGCSRASATPVWLRFHDYETRVYENEGLEEFAVEIRNAALSTEFRPGEGADDHCKYCPRMVTCPAHAAKAKHAIESITGKVDWGVAELAASGAVPEFLATCALAEKTARAGRAAVRKYVMEHGAFEQGEKVVEMVERKTRKVLVREAWEILSEALGPDIDKAVKISAAQAEKVVGSKARRGDKGRARARLMGRLEEAGALERETSLVLSVKAKEEEE